jgi:hypothetical protein
MVVHNFRIADFAELMRSGWPDDVDPRRTVLLERGPARESAANAPSATSSPEAASAGTARIVRYANTEVDIEVDAPAGGLLVLNDVWHPWWRAEVDGSVADILKANVLFRAVAIEPGKHQVRFVFEPFRGAWDELLQKVPTLW